MNDAALRALYAEFPPAQGPVWWFADEQVGQVIPTLRHDVLALTNRSDTAQEIGAAGFQIALGDFEPPIETPAPQTVLYRVSKEKPLVHHLINLALRSLAIGGELLLAGYKNDGLKTYASKAAKLLGTTAKIEKCGGEAYLARIVKLAQPGDLLPDEDYAQLRTISEAPVLFSKPGIFGWKKIDRGSALLINALPSFLAEFPSAPQRLVDLGCGYGYIATSASQLLPNSEWLLTDNNATARLACQKNCEWHGINARFLLADCASGATGQWDAVLCNPPFHQGFAVENDLTDRFIDAAYRLLRPGGQALFVVNQFIPLQRKAAGRFQSDEVLDEAEGFKVIRLRR